MIFVLWGAASLAVGPTLFGMVLVHAGKLRVLDRMVRLCEDMEDASLEYRSRAGEAAAQLGPRHWVVLGFLLQQDGSSRMRRSAIRFLP